VDVFFVRDGSAVQSKMKKAKEIPTERSKRKKIPMWTISLMEEQKKKRTRRTIVVA
jgi:hypothetical protein